MIFRGLFNLLIRLAIDLKFTDHLPGIGLRLLFITWDGPQVSYLEGLFAPIFQGLRQLGVETSVLQFRWGSFEAGAKTARACQQAGIEYQPIFISHRYPSIGGPIAAIANSRIVRSAIARYQPDVVMPRSHLPALALLAARPPDMPAICFDADGLPADERVETGAISRFGPAYRTLRLIESAIVRRSASTLVRSQFAAEVLAERSGVPLSRFFLVASGRDPNQFQPGTSISRAATRAQLGMPLDAPVLAYAGSIGPQYRFDLTVRVVSEAVRRCPKTRFLLITGSPDLAEYELKNSPIRQITTVLRADPPDVAPLLATADVGLCFRTQSFSMRAVAPVKLGEYLLCGLPVIGTPGIGDTSEAERQGLFFNGNEVPESAADWVLNEVMARRSNYRSRARRLGMVQFKLPNSVGSYFTALSGALGATTAKTGTVPNREHGARTSAM